MGENCVEGGSVMSQKKRIKPPVLLWALLALLLACALLWGLGFLPTTVKPGPHSVPTPTPAPEPTPDPYRNDKAQLDVSDLAQGVVRVRYTGGEDKPIKVQITKEGGKDYNYDLNAAGFYETFPFTEGEGVYTLKVLEHKADKLYTPVYSLELAVAPESEFAPFLRPSQFVNYGGAVTTLAAEVMEPGETDADKAALAFDYVVDHLAYDDDKAATVEGGYLPDLDDILAEGKGICFDYAALLCAMLRSQNIPCKLLVGDSGDLYHAWVEVWCETEGLVDDAVPLAADSWTRLDPTFVSNDERSPFIFSYVTDDSNYRVQYTY